MKLGLIVNPIAGMGGRVGLKGTDGPEVLEKALSLGAVPESPEKAKKALKVLLPLKDNLQIITYPGKMGEEEAIEVGFEPTVLGDGKGDTSPLDTEQAAKQMVEAGVDIILFAGGDGTARNICSAIGTEIPVIGIPAGVKIHSAVYANHPRAAGEVVLKYLQNENMNTKESEVMDIDEEAFRKGTVTTRLYGYMKIPVEEGLIQVTKSGGGSSEAESLEGISERIVDDMEDDVFYIIGSGTSIRPIMDKLELPNTLLGIDIVKNKELVASDVNEKQILDIIGDNKAKIIVTVIGGQGYIFGRGNQQLSAEVIKRVGKANIRIIATKSKLMSLEDRPLLVDTGNDEVNSMFTGYTRVLSNYDTENIMEIKGL
ncbi:putative inorganic polyphosphate/ATP-NAD kinase [Gottschalkia acidurici 9a]|uniref:Inorganic polyphosphate/ATP-NAD kinase n=1 Tax=Gottschalkia acidurici (strain ATCC 7906 / DSM 604 / BCRC 14475 / CIP 104303 / KCTC 5404 / NCIMB 10678 / 9a) TaxID=1128398 RepID=K0AYY0_GOTA9|nr:ATP-NAD kinase family protein [Gottschalkia acidurici]AFS79008.1 putative inorganic polyphosphate/ATP-NAD kinase [Gottschalkia acidurici 9a]